MKNEKITFTAVVAFEITTSEAIQILADVKPSQALSDWIDGHKMLQGSGTHNQGNLERHVVALLLENAIAEARQLTMSCDPDAADNAAGFVKE